MRKSRGVNTYSGAHRNTSIVRGVATGYVCECGNQAAEWAYDHENPCPDERTGERGQKFSVDPYRYKPMCRRCHRLFDKSAITHCPNGHPYSGDNLIVEDGKRKCRSCVYARNAARRKKFPMTPEQRERKLELQRKRRRAVKGAGAVTA